MEIAPDPSRLRSNRWNSEISHDYSDGPTGYDDRSARTRPFAPIKSNSVRIKVKFGRAWVVFLSDDLGCHAPMHLMPFLIHGSNALIY